MYISERSCARTRTQLFASWGIYSPTGRDWQPYGCGGVEVFVGSWHSIAGADGNV